MQRVVAVGMAGLALVIIIGVLIAGVMRARWESAKVRSQNHLRVIGGEAVWHATPPGEAMPDDPLAQIPAGTVVNVDLEPEQRLAWHASLLVYLAALGLTPEELPRSLRADRPWDDDSQQPAIRTRIPTFLCPADPPPADPLRPGVTQYVGIAGLGADAATLSPDDPRAGAFRYDTPTPLSHFRDGTSHTIFIGETNHEIGPWAQGGPATLRGVDPDRERYIGIGEPFGGLHADGAWFAYADGSVRFITERVYPPAFRAQVLLAGAEQE